MTDLAASLDGIEAVVFDLDGTLVDTLPDLADAINRMLAEEGRPALDSAAVKRMIGDGAMMLVERALAAAGPTPDAEACAAPRRRFLDFYTAAVSRRSRPYAGVVETLGALRTAGLRLGVCTNKPFAPAQRLLADLDLAGFFAAVVGGDSAEAKKPDGRHLLATLDSLGAAHGGAVMVGDSAVDMAAARDAGVAVIAVGYGYANVAAAALGADAVIDRFAALPDALARLARRGAIRHRRPGS